MESLKLSDKQGLMLALDVESYLDAEKIISENKDYIDAVKIGTTLLTSPQGGFELIGKISKNYNLPVFVDAKLKDVTHVIISTILSYKQHGASAVSCWADIGQKAICFINERLKSEIDLVIMTALTSLPFGQIENTAKKNIMMAVDCGCEYVQIPGNFPKLISWARKNTQARIKIVSCGIGHQGGKIGQAIKNGATYEIIGRHILDSYDISTTLRDTHRLIHQNFHNPSKE